MADGTILNAGFEFERDAPLQHKQAFLGVPRKIKLELGVTLYRFITPEDARRGFAGNQVWRSPWWFSLSTLREILRVARLNKTSVQEAGRARLAVSDSFSPTMESVCAILLTAPVWAWTGRASGQPKGEPENVWYIGGGEQLYLPNLADASGLSSAYARLQYFGRSENLF